MIIRVNASGYAISTRSYAMSMKSNAISTRSSTKSCYAISAMSYAMSMKSYANSTRSDASSYTSSTRNYTISTNSYASSINSQMTAKWLNLKVTAVQLDDHAKMQLLRENCWKRTFRLLNLTLFVDHSICVWSRWGVLKCLTFVQNTSCNRIGKAHVPVVRVSSQRQRHVVVREEHFCGKCSRQ